MLGIYITAGYPNIESTKKALRILDDKGVELIELGVPFSDPMADGPVIQEASFQALENGTNLEKIFSMVQELRQEGFKDIGKGLDNTILFSYYNPLFSYGFDELILKCQETGVRGVLIPDLPLEEASELCEKFKKAHLDLILLAAITSSKERLEKICELSNPWIYLVSRTGVTGSSADISNLQASDDAASQEIKLKEVIKVIKAQSNKKLALGFGIDSKEKVDNAHKLGADMAIIGSKTVKLLGKEGIEGFSKFIHELI